MANHIQKLSRLMRLSWDIQKRRKSTRSKSLQAAWAICSNEEVTVYYLVRKLNHDKPVPQKVLNQMALFNQ